MPDHFLGADIPDTPADSTTPAAESGAAHPAAPANIPVVLTPGATPPVQTLLVTVDDSIVVSGTILFPPVTVNVNVRVMDAAGEIKRTAYSFVGNNTTPGVIGVITGLNGWLVSVTAATPGAQVGTAYIHIALQQASKSANPTEGRYCTLTIRAHRSPRVSRRRPCAAR